MYLGDDATAKVFTTRSVSGNLPSAKQFLLNGSTGGALTEMEKSLYKIISTVLNLPPEKLLREKSFLKHGGDSIAAIKVVSKCMAENIAITTVDIMKCENLSELASTATMVHKQAVLDVPLFNLLPATSRTTIIQDVIRKCGVSSDQIQDVYPCTALQEGLMALTVTQPGSYATQLVFKAAESLDIERFRSAWQTTVASCDNLRTRIVLSGETTVQAILREDISWQAVGGIGLAAYLENDKLVDMTYGSSLSRYAVVQDGIGYHFVWTIHHAIYDAWCLARILGIAQRAYYGEPIAKRTSFANYIEHTISSSVLESNDFWTSQLSEAEANDFPRPRLGKSKTRRQNMMNYTISSPRWPVSAVTVSTVLRAAWALVVGRYSESDDVIFGTTVSGRNAPVRDIEEILGPTIATLPVRVHLDYHQTVLQFLQTLQAQSSATIPYEHTGMQNIAKLGQRIRDACDFKNLFVIQPDRNALPFKLLELVDTVGVQQVFHPYPLVFECELSPDRIDIRATYDSDILSPAQIQSICNQFEHVIEQLARPDDSLLLGQVDLCSPEDLQQIKAWNATYPKVINACVHDLISEQAMARPQSEAICSWDCNFTYAELETASELLARHLISLGVGPQTLVPLCFEKSAWTVVAILAVLKAGGAFVSLDPSHPQGRRQDIVDQLGAKLMLTSPHTAHRCAGMTEALLVISPSLYASLSSSSSRVVLSARVTPQDTAYVIFTSGSTGRPKGVVMQHGAICASSMGLGDVLGITNTSRTLQFASYVFDACVTEIITTLVHGGCVCVPSDDSRLSRLGKEMSDMAVNWAILTPSIVRLIGPDKVPDLKTLVLGGEAPAQDNLDDWLGRIRLINAYGPAEACVICTAHEWKISASSGLSTATIGRAINCVSWIVDPSDHNRLSPIGCVGELLIQGPSLAVGYLHDEAKTAAAFIEGPDWLPDYGSGQPRRLYKTGDLVCYNPDGTIEFRGRKDTQIKLNGQRIELGDIEHHVRRQLPAAKHVVVDLIPPPHGNGNPMIWAFVSLREGEHAVGNPHTLVLEPEALRGVPDVIRSLEKSIPQYMIPSVFIPLSGSLKTTSGKLDRARYRQLAAELAKQGISAFSVGEKVKFVAPASAMEKTLQLLWGKALSISPEEIGVNSNFLQLGGDSVTAIRLATSAREQDIGLTVANIFDDARLGHMAVTATIVVDKEATPDTLPFSLLPTPLRTTIIHDITKKYEVSSDQIQDIYPCTPRQEDFMIQSMKPPGAWVSRLVFPLPASIDVTRFQAAWEKIVIDTPILRTRIILGLNSQYYQAVVNDAVSWQYAGDLERYLADDTKWLIRLGAPLHRSAIIEDEQSKRHFVWTVHHALYDGWCLPLILQNLQRIYDGGLVGQPIPFTRFIKYLSSIDLEKSEAFWQRKLEGRPTHYPRASVTEQPREEQYLHHEVHVSRKPGSSITMSNLIRAAWAIIVGRYSDSDDIVYGVASTGRNAPLPGITHIIGPTIHSVPFRVRMNSQTTIADFLNEIQDQGAAMLPFEHLGLRAIRRLSADSKHACNFQSSLIVEPLPKDESDLLGSQFHFEMHQGQHNVLTLPISVFCWVRDESITKITIVFNSRIISSTQALRLLGQLEKVLQQLIDLRGNTQIGDLQQFSLLANNQE
jgi:amino acid adenylation domain-containing protein